MPSLDRPTLGGLAAILLWSTTVAIARSLSESLGPLQAGAVVYTIGGFVSLGPAVLSRERLRRILSLRSAYALVCGALFVLYSAALFLAVGLVRTRIQALEVALLNYLWPACTLLLSIPILGNRGRWSLVPGTALALSGVYLVLGQEGQVSFRSIIANLDDNPVAYTCGLVAAVSWGLYSNLARRLAGPAGRGGVHLFIPATGLVLIVVSRAAGASRPAALSDVGTISEALFLGIVTSVAYRLWDSAMRNGNVVLVAAASYTTPLLSTLVSAVYLSVVPGASLWAGCLLLVGGSLLSWRSIHPQNPGLPAGGAAG